MSFQPKILNWFFSLLLLVPAQLLAQQSQDSTISMRLKKSETIVAKADTVKQKTFFERDLKIGWDMSNLLLGALSPKRSGLDFSVDVTVKKNLYTILEFGKNSYEEVSDQITYNSDGNYFKLGIDVDVRKGEKDKSRDMFYLGARYAFATFEQQIMNYQFSSSYWPAITGEVETFNNQAHWVEAISGFKVEVFKNIYLGLGLRFKLMLFKSGDETLKSAPYIPGFGKTSGTLVVGFNYNLYYNLPLNYTKKSSNRDK